MASQADSSSQALVEISARSSHRDRWPRWKGAYFRDRQLFAGVDTEMAAYRAGISLPETLLAIATTAILAALAVAVWQTHTVARHVDSAVDVVRPILTVVARAYLESGEPPRRNADAGLAADPASHRSRYLESVDVRDGTVSLYFGHRANPSIAGRTLRIEARLDETRAQVLWQCLEVSPDDRSPALPRRYWPELCDRGTGEPAATP